MKIRRSFVHKTLKPAKLIGQSQVKTWSRASVILPYMIKHTLGVYNGRSFIQVHITDDKVGYRLGEFARTRKRGSDPRGKAKRIRRF